MGTMLSFKVLRYYNMFYLASDLIIQVFATFGNAKQNYYVRF